MKQTKSKFQYGIDFGTLFLNIEFSKITDRYEIDKIKDKMQKATNDFINEIEGLLEGGNNEII